MVGPIAVAVTVATTWPLSARLNSGADHEFDSPVQAWALDWVQHALTSDAKVFDANMFAPAPHSLTFSDALLGIAIPELIARPLGLEPIGMLNLATLGGVVANALAAYWLGRLLTRRILGAAVCAAVYAFAPYSLLTAIHLHVLVRPGLPLAVGLIWLVADRSEARSGGPEGSKAIAETSPATSPVQPRLWPLVCLLAVTVAWQGSVSFYSAAFCSVVAVVTLAVRFRSLWWRGLTGVGIALAAGAMPVLLIARVYLANRRRYGNLGWSLSGVSQLSASVGSFVTTASGNTVWGGILGTAELGYDLHRVLLFPGAMPLLLAAVGLFACLRADDRGARRVGRLGLALTTVGALLALGASDVGWRRFSLFRLLFEVLPGWKSIRAADRFWVVGMLGLAILAAVGACRVVDSLDGWWRSRSRLELPVLVGVALVAAIMIEGHRANDLVPIRTAPVDSTIAELPRGGVVYLPVNPDDRLGLAIFGQAEYVYRSTAHHRPTVNGKGSFFPPSYLGLSKRLQSLPSQSARNCLLAYDIRYIVVTPRVKGTKWERLQQPRLAAPLVLIERSGEDLLYRVPGRADAPCPLGN